MLRRWYGNHVLRLSDRADWVVRWRWNSARAGYRVSEIVSGASASSRRKARILARQVHATWRAEGPSVDADVIWFCVPDREIARRRDGLRERWIWKGKIALHSSGALGSDELRELRRRGAAVASVHPLMTFVSQSVPSLKGVPFALEGDAAALRVAGRIVRDLGGEAFFISKKEKLAYHAWGAFLAPLFVSLLVTGEQVARAAGLSKVEARRKMLPIVRQTLANYAKLGPAGAFSGPIVRGDAEVVRRAFERAEEDSRGARGVCGAGDGRRCGICRRGIGRNWRRCWVGERIRGD